MLCLFTAASLLGLFNAVDAWLNYGSKPEGKKCLSFCLMGDLCKGGACRVRQDTCTMYCICPPGTTGRRCEFLLPWTAENRTEFPFLANKTTETVKLSDGLEIGKPTAEPELNLPSKKFTSSSESPVIGRENIKSESELRPTYVSDHVELMHLSELGQRNDFPQPTFTCDVAERTLTGHAIEPTRTLNSIIPVFAGELSTSFLAESKKLDSSSWGNQNNLKHPILKTAGFPRIIKSINIYNENSVDVDSGSSVTLSSYLKNLHMMSSSSRFLEHSYLESSINVELITSSYGTELIRTHPLRVDMKSQPFLFPKPSPVFSTNIILTRDPKSLMRAVDKQQDLCNSSCSNGYCIQLNGSVACIPRSYGSRSYGENSNATPNSCLPGFFCYHGKCDKSALREGKLKCKCDPKWIGTFCNVPCGMDCGLNGRCISLNDTTVCQCNWNYTGKLCDKRKQLSSGSHIPVYVHWYIVGSCCVVLLMLIMAVVAVPYYLWRRRWLVIMKVVHYFKSYEDDDGKSYDAFVSYKSSKEDEHFVLYELYPKLEKEMNFKLCLHFRDFTPGETIANNIISAIENSRRTIMILSPNYVESEWCRMEYQKAQHEMLQLKHKLIPVILKDISHVKNVDRNLKTIMDSVTYLQWPGGQCEKKLSRFWKQLELSLPKIKQSAEVGVEPSSPSQKEKVQYGVDMKQSDMKAMVRVSSTEAASEKNDRGKTETERETDLVFLVLDRAGESPRLDLEASRCDGKEMDKLTSREKVRSSKHTCREDFVIVDEESKDLKKLNGFDKRFNLNAGTRERFAESLKCFLERR